MRSLVQVQDGPYLYVGGIAQLVERLLCKQDVSGSSPLTSTDQLPDNSNWRLLFVKCDLDVVQLNEPSFLSLLN